jgi:hypothetical protein
MPKPFYVDRHTDILKMHKQHLCTLLKPVMGPIEGWTLTVTSRGMQRQLHRQPASLGPSWSTSQQMVRAVRESLVLQYDVWSSLSYRIISKVLHCICLCFPFTLTTCMQSTTDDYNGVLFVLIANLTVTYPSGWSSLCNVAYVNGAWIYRFKYICFEANNDTCK